MNGGFSTMKQSLRLSFTTIMLSFLALPALHAQDESAAAKAVRYQKGCDDGSSLDCITLALMVANGDGVTKDEARGDALIQKAADLYQNACDGGNTSACTNVGDMWRNYSDNDAKAVPLYRKACDGGDPAGCGKLGDMYADALGVPEDYTQALVFYGKACDGGYVSACDYLGDMYDEGKGVTQDHAQAFALFLRPAMAAMRAAVQNWA